MTRATWNRIRRLYEATVGYDPEGEWEPASCLETLRWMRCAVRFCPDDAAAYTGPTLTSAQLRNA